jgi:hypothetical protein
MQISGMARDAARDRIRAVEQVACKRSGQYVFTQALCPTENQEKLHQGLARIWVFRQIIKIYLGKYMVARPNRPDKSPRYFPVTARNFGEEIGNRTHIHP